jgi:hypothetical protein
MLRLNPAVIEPSGVAQSAEHSAVNRRVVGSSPTPRVDAPLSRRVRGKRTALVTTARKSLHLQGKSRRSVAVCGRSGWTPWGGFRSASEEGRREASIVSEGKRRLARVGRLSRLTYEASSPRRCQVRGRGGACAAPSVRRSAEARTCANRFAAGTRPPRACPAPPRARDLKSRWLALEGATALGGSEDPVRLRS